MTLSLFSMHDQAAWLQPHMKIYLQFKLQEETKKDTGLGKIHQRMFSRSHAKDYASEQGGVECLLRDRFPSLKTTVYITFLTCMLFFFPKDVDVLLCVGN